MILGIPTHTPTQQPSPTIPSPTPGTPVILSFFAEPTQAGPGESVTLRWESTGGARATIDLVQSQLTVPTSGSTIVTIDEDRRHDLQIGLVVSNDSGQSAYRSLTIQLRCPYTYFFEPAPTGWASCPYRPAGFSWAAEQPFENGRMIWLQEILGESTASGTPEGPYVYVLYEDDQLPQWQRFNDTWTSEQPETDPAIVPPEGLRQPIRGFGKLWRTNAAVRERLGWALEPERGFDGAYQIDWEPAYEAEGAYLRTADGRVLALSVLGLWNYVTP